jgi:DNA invertase Pin-like site-specific DNA recombinase
MATTGYARVSTDEQCLDLQLSALKAVGCDKIQRDQGVSGSTTTRPGLDKALGSLKDGDTFVVWRLDRLGRSLPHLIDVVTGLKDRGVAFRSLTESIDTSTAAGELIFHVFGALAQFERSLIRERTQAGIAAAQARGQHCGRRPSLTPTQAKHAAELIQSGKSEREVGRILGVSHTSIRRALARITEVREDDSIPPPKKRRRGKAR